MKATLTAQDSLYIDLPKCATVSGTLKYPKKYGSKPVLSLFSGRDYMTLSDNSFSIPNIPYGTYTFPFVIEEYGMTNLFIIVTNSLTELGDIKIKPTKYVTVRGRFSPVPKEKEIEYFQLGRAFTTQMKSDGTFVCTNIWPYTDLEMYYDDTMYYETNIFVPAKGIDLGTINIK